MKKGRIVILDRWRGRDCAVRIDNGQVTDLLIDPDSDAPLPGAIFRARADRPMKGQAGLVLYLGDGRRGYLRHANGIAQGATMLVQVSSFGESGKAAPVTPKLTIKSRYALITPGAPGINVARKIKDEAERDRLLEIAHEAMDGAGDGFGVILRTACEGVKDDAVAEDVSAMRALAEQVLGDADGPPELLVDAAPAAERAWRDWVDPDPEEVVDDPGALDHMGFAEVLDALLVPHATLPGGGFMMIEETTAFVAVDVNTGGDFSMAAGLKANLAVARDLPRQLRLRGLGGQIVIDMAPMPHKERRQVEQAFARSLREDGIDTVVVGWTGLGHLELQRKRERMPLRLAIA